MFLTSLAFLRSKIAPKQKEDKKKLKQLSEFFLPRPCFVQQKEQVVY